MEKFKIDQNEFEKISQQADYLLQKVPFKDRLYELMSERNLKQTDLMATTGIAKSLISMYLKGTRVPKQDKIILIADNYDVNPLWLSGFNVPMEKQQFKPEEVSSNQIDAIARIATDNRLIAYAERIMKLTDFQRESVFGMIDMYSAQNEKK